MSCRGGLFFLSKFCTINIGVLSYDCRRSVHILSHALLTTAKAAIIARPLDDGKFSHAFYTNHSNTAPKCTRAQMNLMQSAFVCREFFFESFSVTFSPDGYSCWNSEQRKRRAGEIPTVPWRTESRIFTWYFTEPGAWILECHWVGFV